MRCLFKKTQKTSKYFTAKIKTIKSFKIFYSENQDRDFSVTQDNIAVHPHGPKHVPIRNELSREGRGTQNIITFHSTWMLFRPKTHAETPILSENKRGA